MASEIKVDTVSEKTSANGVTIDGVNIKDSKIVTANSVDSDVYVDGSIDTAHIADLNVTTGKIAADAITAAKIADNAVVTAGINADAVTGAKIADDAINSEHYTDGSIDTAHLADGQVTTAKLASAVFTGATDIGANLADADLFLVDDGAGGTIRKTAASRLKTYVGGGITHASQWRTTTNVTGDNEPLVNMETNDTAGYGLIGDNMTESSGVFTFPTTGYWLVKITGGFFYDGDSAYNNISINYTANNGTNWALKSYSSGMCQTTSSAAGFANANAAFLFDITDTGNQKVRFGGDVQNNGTTTMGGSNYHTGTHITFMRLGDT